MRTPTTLVLTLAVAAFFPLTHAGAEPGYGISYDHVYGHKAGMALTFDMVTPTENANGVGLLYLVSRGWISNYFDLEKAMADSKNQGGRLWSIVDQGFTLFVVRHGSSPYFTVPDAVTDVRRAVRYIRHNAADLGVDPERLGVFGASAGGHLSLMLGTTADHGDADSADPVERTPSRVAAVVAYFPPVDLQTSLESSDRSPPFDFDPELADDVSPVLHVSADDAPTLLVHGDVDDQVPLSQSERILAAFEKAGVSTRLVVIRGASHGFYGTHSRKAAEALTDWFERYLVRPRRD